MSRGKRGPSPANREKLPLLCNAKLFTTYTISHRPFPDEAGRKHHRRKTWRGVLVMGKWIQSLDQILRGEATQPANLRQGKIDVPAGGLSIIMVLLGCFYGFCMGWFAVLNRDTPEYRQFLATVLKVPALFFLTLLVTFPSLYVFNAMVG